MIKLKKDKYLNIILLVIILFGFINRFINPTFGSPVLYVNGDEAPNYLNALYIIAEKNPFIDVAIYPPFGAYIQIPFLLLAFIGELIFGGIKSIAELKFFILTNQGYFLFIPRIISGIFGGLTLFLIYKITNLLYPKKQLISLFSTLLVALSFNHVQMSNSGRPWAPSMFFFLLAVLFSIKSVLYIKNKLVNSITAAFYTVISYGFHQVGIFSLWFFIVLRVYQNKHSFSKVLKDKNTMFGIIIGNLGVLFIMILNSYGPQTGLFRDIGQYPSNYSLISKLTDIVRNNHIIYYLQQFLVSEPIIFIFFIVSLLITRRLNNHIFRAVFFYLISTFLIVSFSFAQTRYMLPVILIMPFFAGFALEVFISSLKRGVIKQIIITVIVIIAAFNSVLWSSLYIKKPTFIQAHDWIEHHIKPEEVILSTAIRFSAYTPAKDVLPIQQKEDPGFYHQVAELLKEGEYPRNVRNIIYLGKVGRLVSEETPRILETLPVSYKYIIDIYWDELKDSKLSQVDKTKYSLKASFSPLKNRSSVKITQNILTTVDRIPLPLELLRLERAGPFVDIYAAN